MDLYYRKNKNKKLFNVMKENMSITDIQNYIPIYKNYFSLNEDNYNSINLNEKNPIQQIIETKDDNHHTIDISNNNTKEQVSSYFKLSPLVDPIKFLTGKYVSNNINQLPKLTNNNCFEKILDINNVSYVDSFFYFLSSKLLHNHNFIHGTDFYGSFLAIKNNYKINIGDDIEYILKHEYFHEHKDKLFKLDERKMMECLRYETRNYKHRLSFKNTIKNISLDSINIIEYDELFENSDSSSNNLNHSPMEDIITNPMENIVTNSDNDTSNNTVIDYDTLSYDAVYEHKKLKNISKSNGTSSSSSSSCSSNSSDTNISHKSMDIDNESDDYITDDESNCSNHTECSSNKSNEDDEEVLECTINTFPVQVICLEQMHNTLDYLMENEELNTEEWRSALFQVIMILITYQKVFNFTHNDLHSNNIMFNKTDKKYLYYNFNSSYYKVPTFGRIYKIIDYGRAIYKFHNKTCCSDSFAKKGDAATQYNFGCYMNPKKPLLEPNYSFDLCRLACSLYDYFFDDISDDNKANDAIESLVSEWCKDDKGRNVLYKKTGEERYEGFKLYKMIARTVNKHIPSEQVNKKVFEKFKTSRKKINKHSKIMNIDNIPSYI